jgi:branched-chain amino acid transport system permease protein
MRTLLGPTVGALFTIVLNEALRVAFGTNFIGAAYAIYGIMLILFIIFMPQGIVGLIEGVSGRSWRRSRGAVTVPATRL